MPPHRILFGSQSCVDCLAWGVVGARRCSSCTMLRHCYPGVDAECTGCGRVLALKKGFCRLCWQQAAYESKTAGGQKSTVKTGPVSTLSGKKELRGKTATLERLRVDRQLKEALDHGPDPLHLASMFGLDPKTAIRYAKNAHLLLITTTEEQHPAGSNEPKGQIDP
jgi:hypothetical protein